MRPIYHWTDSRIKAHIAICFMALSCMRFAEYEVAARYKKISPSEIRRQKYRKMLTKYYGFMT